MCLGCRRLSMPPCTCLSTCTSGSLHNLWHQGMNCKPPCKPPPSTCSASQDTQTPPRRSSTPPSNGPLIPRNSKSRGRTCHTGRRSRASLPCARLSCTSLRTRPRSHSSRSTADPGPRRRGSTSRCGNPRPLERTPRLPRRARRPAPHRPRAPAAPQRPRKPMRCQRPLPHRGKRLRRLWPKPCGGGQRGRIPRRKHRQRPRPPGGLGRPGPPRRRHRGGPCCGLS
mmetsp:Transcript_112127/g.280985  ORF Transcript_112127/g.280985 Transcript_112127/m.280985 type:complete len:226 (+) Transcript_112127:723-1400(+)